MLIYFMIVIYYMIYQQYTEDVPFSWVDNVGNKIIDEVSIKCDGQNLDTIW